MNMHLNDLVRYIVKYYPYKDELSKARLNKLIYLIDWKSAIDNQEQMSDIEWIFNHYGPYVSDIETRLLLDDRFDIEKTTNFYGSEKNIIKIKSDTDFKEPNEKQKKVMDFIIDATKGMYWNKFINTVYSTYPIQHSQRGEQLDLVKLANEYKKVKNNE